MKRTLVVLVVISSAVGLAGTRAEAASDAPDWTPWVESRIAVTYDPVVPENSNVPMSFQVTVGRTHTPPVGAEKDGISCDLAMPDHPGVVFQAVSAGLQPDGTTALDVPVSVAGAWRGTCVWRPHEPRSIYRPSTVDISFNVVSTTPVSGVVAFTDILYRQDPIETNIESADLATGRVQTLVKNATSPTWSPDGTRLAFINLEGHVGFRRADGSIQTTNVPAYGANTFSAADMAWSPDGSKLAFVYYNLQVWVMNTSWPFRPHPVTPANQEGMEPSWSPDSSQILYGGYDGQHGADLWIVNADGTDPRDVTNTPTVEESRPDWSPDGQRMAFLSSAYSGLAVSDIDGTAVHPVAQTSAFCCGAPDWSPNGRWIAYIGNSGLTIVRPTGYGQQLVATPGEPFQPEWNPAG